MLWTVMVYIAKLRKLCRPESNKRVEALTRLHIKANLKLKCSPYNIVSMPYKNKKKANNSFFSTQK